MILVHRAPPRTSLACLVEWHRLRFWLSTRMLPAADPLPDPGALATSRLFRNWPASLMWAPHLWDGYRRSLITCCGSGTNARTCCSAFTQLTGPSSSGWWTGWTKPSPVSTANHKSASRVEYRRPSPSTTPPRCAVTWFSIGATLLWTQEPAGGSPISCRQETDVQASPPATAFPRGWAWCRRGSTSMHSPRECPCSQNIPTGPWTSGRSVSQRRPSSRLFWTLPTPPAAVGIGSAWTISPAILSYPSCSPPRITISPMLKWTLK